MGVGRGGGGCATSYFSRSLHVLVFMHVHGDAVYIRMALMVTCSLNQVFLMLLRCDGDR